MIEYNVIYVCFPGEQRGSIYEQNYYGKRISRIRKRPYESLLTYGPEYLSDAELLAVIIRSGTKRSEVCGSCAESVK